MKLQGITIKGRSVSGYSTSITAPDYGIAFDCGITNHDTIQADTVLITHGHLDHLGDIVRQAYIRAMRGMQPTTFIVPHWLVKRVNELFTFWAKVQKARKCPYTVKVLGWDGRVELGKGRFLHAFETIHRIPSQGYVLTEERTTLKDEYRGQTGWELGALRKEGVELDRLFEVPMVAFTGDTRASVYDRELLALQAKLLIVECTFLDDVTVAEARKKGHTHISELADKAYLFADVGTLMLSHFSQRYCNADIEAAISKLPRELRAKTRYLPVGK